MKPIDSVTTTFLSNRDSETGTPRGGLGLATRENSNRITSWLAKQDPRDMDQVAVSRALSRDVGLRVKYEGRYPEDGQSYTIAVGCEVSGSPENMAATLDDLVNFMLPAPVRLIEEWLAELSVLVAKRQDDEFSEELRVSAYSSRLAVYPADVVRTVLLEETYKFWPTWGELERRCKVLTSPRKNMIAALRRGPQRPEPSFRRATEDEKARIQSLVDEMFPSASSELRKAAVEEAMKGNCIKEEIEQ